jgi:hypothetical protein
MKRTVFAFVAIFLTFGICVLGLNTLIKTCEEMTIHLEELSKLAREKDVDSTIEKATSVVSLWHDTHGKIEAFVPHEETDELEEIINSLPIYAKQGNMERLEERTEMAIIRLNHIIKNEKPLLSNIF